MKQYLLPFILCQIISINSYAMMEGECSNGAGNNNGGEDQKECNCNKDEDGTYIAPTSPLTIVVVFNDGVSMTTQVRHIFQYNQRSHFITTTRAFEHNYNPGAISDIFVRDHLGVRVANLWTPELPLDSSQPVYLNQMPESNYLYSPNPASHEP